jgi:hypothetical protein
VVAPTFAYATPLVGQPVTLSLGDSNSTPVLLPPRPSPLQDSGLINNLLSTVRNSIQLSQSVSQKYGALTDYSGHVQDTPPTTGTFGSSPFAPTYFDPTLSMVGGSYEYTTSFGVYDLTSLGALNDYLISFRTLDMASGYVASSAFVLLENHSGAWLSFSPLYLSANPVSASNTQFAASWEINYPTGKGPNTQDIAQARLTVDFGKNSLPKISVELVRYSYQPNPDTMFFYWNDLGLKDFQWTWIIVPSRGYDNYTSSSHTSVSVASLSSSQSVPSSDHIEFSGNGKTWQAEWKAQGTQPINFTNSNLLTQWASVTQFNVNDALIDPDFGITSTGSTSYPTVTAGETNAGASNDAGGSASTNTLRAVRFDLETPITATDLYVDVTNVSGSYHDYCRGFVYSDNAGYPNALQVQTNTIDIQAAAWVHFTLDTTTYFSATSWWLGFNCYVTTAAIGKMFDWTTGFTNEYYRATGSYGGTSPNSPASFPGGATGSAYHTSIYLSGVMIEGTTKGTRVQFTGGTGSIVTSFSFYTHTGAAGDHFTPALYSDTTGAPQTDSIGTDTSYVANGANVLSGFPITTTAAGTLTSITIYIENAAGNIRVGLYSTYSSSKFSGLIAQSASAAAVFGKNVLSVPGGSLSASTTYYVAMQSDNAGLNVFGVGSGTRYYVGYAYNTFPDPTANLSSTGQTYKMQITYNTSNPMPYQRLWYGPSTSSANTTWNVVNEGAGTRDNGWDATLTNSAWYWFVFQWDNVDTGPSYAAGGAGTGFYKVQTYGNLDSTWSGGTATAENYSEYATYNAVVSITWALSGNVGSDAQGTILTIDGTGYVYADFPKAFTWIQASTHTIACTNPVSSSNSGERYSFVSYTSTSLGTQTSCSFTYTTPASGETVTANYNTQYDLKPKAIDKYSASTILNTAQASMNVTFTNATTKIVFADTSGYLDFGWVNSAQQAYITAKYAGTIANSTWQSGTYTISSTTVYQWPFEYNASITMPTAGIQVPTSDATDSTVWNVTSYYLLGNSSATFSTGTLYVYYATPTYLAGSQAISSPSFTALTASQSLAKTTGSSAYFNITDGYVWLRTTTTVSYQITISGFTFNAPGSIASGATMSVPYSFINTAKAVSTNLTLSNYFLIAEIRSSDMATLISSQPFSYTNANPGVLNSGTLSVSTPSSLSPSTGYDLRLILLQHLMNGTDITITYSDSAFAVSVPSVPAQANGGAGAIFGANQTVPTPSSIFGPLAIVGAVNPWGINGLYPPSATISFDVSVLNRAQGTATILIQYWVTPASDPNTAIVSRNLTVTQAPGEKTYTVEVPISKVGDYVFHAYVTQGEYTTTIEQNFSVSIWNLIWLQLLILFAVIGFVAYEGGNKIRFHMSIRSGY